MAVNNERLLVTINNVEELKKELGELNERREELEENLNVDEYEDMLNEGGDVVICGLSYQASTAFKDIDPIAYRCGHNDYNDGLLTEINNDIEDKEQEITDYI